MSADESELSITEKPAYRLESRWTDEETVHRLLEELEAAGIDPDKFVVAERRIEVDAGP